MDYLTHFESCVENHVNEKADDVEKLHEFMDFFEQHEWSDAQLKSVERSIELQALFRKCELATRRKFTNVKVKREHYLTDD